jgi:hypothetical protein
VRVRRTAAVVAPLALLALTACEKPAPQVTVHAGGTVVNLDAIRYCHEPDNCKEHGGATAKLEVSGGDQISVNVPTHVAEEGWYIQQGERRIEVRKKLHYSLDARAVEFDKPLQIIQGEPGAQPEGLWELTLAPAS